MLVAGTYRVAEVDTGHPLADALAELRREHSFERIVLDGLRPDELADLIAGVTGSAGDERFVHAVHDETEGNPFFAEEVSGTLPSRGRWSSAWRAARLVRWAFRRE